MGKSISALRFEQLSKRMNSKFSSAVSVVLFGPCVKSSAWHNSPSAEWKTASGLFIALPNSPSWCSRLHRDCTEKLAVTDLSTRLNWRGDRRDASRDIRTAKEEQDKTRHAESGWSFHLTDVNGKRSATFWKNYLASSPVFCASAAAHPTPPIYSLTRCLHLRICRDLCCHKDPDH